MNYSYNQRGGFLSSWPPVTKSLIIINVLVFVMTMLNEDFMIRNFALFYPASPLFKPWQIVTHMFMHGGFWHIFFNMYTLFIFGSVLERVWGPKKYLLFYFVTGLGAAALHTGVQWIEVQHYMSQLAAGNQAAAAGLGTMMHIPTVGASGAIYGLLLGYGMLFPDAVLALIFPPVRAYIRCYRADYRTDGDRRQCSAFRTSWRHAFRLAADSLLETQEQALSELRLICGKIDGGQRGKRLN